MISHVGQHLRQLISRDGVQNAQRRVASSKPTDCTSFGPVKNGQRLTLRARKCGALPCLHARALSTQFESDRSEMDPIRIMYSQRPYLILPSCKSATKMGNAVVRVNGDEFAIVRPLGEGGFSTVHEVRRGKERFALKRSRGVSEREDIERAQMEIKVQRQLQHPNNLRLLNAEIRSNRDAAKEHRNGQSLLRAAAMDGVVFGDTKEVLMVFPIMHGGTLQAFLERAAANSECTSWSIVEPASR